jgi:hypothetical protein
MHSLIIGSNCEDVCACGCKQAERTDEHKDILLLLYVVLVEEQLPAQNLMLNH